MLKVLELFAGIGACSKALTNLGIEHEIVDAVEIDKYAVQSFNAVHGTNFEPQDITQWDKDVQCDLIMHGSPCQDFSVAGKGAGGDKGSGTRSSLMYETLRIVEKLKPKYVIWENVKNLISKKHRHNFDAYLEAMEKLGYKSSYQVLNAKDYGVPQNRERVFTVSILKEEIIYDDYNSRVRRDQDTIGTLTSNCGASAIRNGWKVITSGCDYQFPKAVELDKRLKDVLETTVDEKYYLSEEQTSKIRVWEERQIKEGRGFRFNVHDGDDIATTMTTTPSRPSTSNYVAIVDDIYGNRPPRFYDKAPTLRAHHAKDLKVVPIEETEPHLKIKNATKKGYVEAYDGDAIDISFAKSDTRRGRVQHGISQTIPSAAPVIGVNDKMRIRRLTPKECWRLMGFDDEDFDKAKASGVSDSQLYKQAGNSIVVNVLEGVLRNLLTNQ